MRIALTERRATNPDEYEGEQFRPRPGTKAAELNQAIKARQRDGNPHQADLDALVPPFHEVDAELQRYKRANVAQRITELEPEYAGDAIQESAVALREALDAYRAKSFAVRDITVDTPGLSGEHAAYDNRIDGWTAVLDEILEADITEPCLTEMGAYKATDR